MSNSDLVRQVVLDTETTGMNFQGPRHEGHRIIEIGAVELINRVPRRTIQFYLNPGRPVDPESQKVHGISSEMLQDQPHFNPDIAAEILSFFEGAELIAHNAPFDLAFLNQEFQLLGYPPYKPESSVFLLQDQHVIIDTLMLAREKFPGRRNSLDALCKRFNINTDHRSLHGALLDAQLLLEVYLIMTGGQIDLALKPSLETTQIKPIEPPLPSGQPLPVILCSEEEKAQHLALINDMRTTEKPALYDNLLAPN